MTTETKTFETRFIIPRYEDPCFAIVNIVVTDESLCKEEKFLTELRRAVTEWVKTSEDGKSVWEYSGNDLNIGDLMSHGGIEDIVALMPGVESIDLDQIGHPRGGNWTYNTVLVNEEEIEEDV